MTDLDYALAIGAGWVLLLVVLMPWLAGRLQRGSIDPYAGLTLDEIRQVTRPQGRPGYRVDAYGRVFYSADWLDDWLEDARRMWGFDDDVA